MALRSTKGFGVFYLANLVTHIFFTDELKLYARNSYKLGVIVEIVDRVSCTVGRDGVRPEKMRSSHHT